MILPEEPIAAPTDPPPEPHALYAAFDRFPAPKGAAVHIGHASLTLFDEVGSGMLVVLGDDEMPSYQRERAGNVDVQIVRCAPGAEDLPDRVERFASQVAALVQVHGDDLELCQVRDPWSAMPVMSYRPRRYRTVYEVNGLPSIELPETLRGLSPSVVARIAAAEDRCIAAADALVAPSSTIADHLRHRGADPASIHVVPNGADVPQARPDRPDAAPPGRYLVYVGALQPWQGVDVLLRAFARVRDLDLDLVICSAWPARRTKLLRRLARRLEIDERVQWHHAVRHRDVAGWLAHADLSIAPLLPTARNLLQGCCPLKVLESMAVGTPVVASDLPVIRQLMVDGVHGRLVPPERPAELARAIRVLTEYPDELAGMGAEGRAHIARTLTWAHNRARTREVYAALRA